MKAAWRDNARLQIVVSLSIEALYARAKASAPPLVEDGRPWQDGNVRRKESRLPGDIRQFKSRVCQRGGAATRGIQLGSRQLIGSSRASQINYFRKHLKLGDDPGHLVLPPKFTPLAHPFGEEAGGYRKDLGSLESEPL